MPVVEPMESPVGNPVALQVNAVMAAFESVAWIVRVAIDEPPGED